MALTDPESLRKYGAPWYREAARQSEEHLRFKETIEVIAGAALLAIPFLVATVGYLAWRVWSCAKGGA